MAGFNYSNIAYDILGDLIAKKSGISFEEYIKVNILTPLEMTESSFYLPDIKKDLRTSPHVENPTQLSKIYPYNRRHAPSSTLNTSILDLSNFSKMIMNKGNFKGVQIIKPETLSMMTTKTSQTETDGFNIGLAWFLYDYKGVKNWEHTGGDTGYSSLFNIMPDKNMSIILLSNHEDFEGKIVLRKIQDLLFFE